MPRELAVSNLAWIGHDDASYLDLLAAEGVHALEVAPSLLFAGDPTAVGPALRNRVRTRIEAAGLRIAALQSLYFARPDVRLFGSTTDVANFIDYSRRVAELCAELGGSTLSFGAPHQRTRGDVPVDAAVDRAAAVFHDLGEHARSLGLRYAIEALPPLVGADFLHNLDDVQRVVDGADSAGVGMLVDTGTTEPEAGLPGSPTSVAHVQVSRLLEPVTRTRRQESWARVLDGYGGVVSIEMKPAFPDDVSGNLAALRTAIRDVATMYMPAYE